MVLRALFWVEVAVSVAAVGWVIYVFTRDNNHVVLTTMVPLAIKAFPRLALMLVGYAFTTPGGMMVLAYIGSLYLLAQTPLERRLVKYVVVVMLLAAFAVGLLFMGLVGK